MNTRRRGLALVSLLVLVVLAACGGNDSMDGMSGMDSTAMPMMDSTAMPMMDNTTMPGMNHGGMAMTEVQFIDGMIVHHQGAITMASEALTQATRPEVKDLAQKIVDAQQPEIEQLQGWRRTWFANEPATDAAMFATMGMGAMTVAADPAKPYDERFLTAMIAHHRGAIQMAETIKGTATHAEITAFATKVITDQTAEITTMETWLKEWGTK